MSVYTFLCLLHICISKTASINSDLFSVGLVVVQTYGEYVAGTLEEEERMSVLKNACPGAGACGGMYTANTMASAIEALGMSLPYRCAFQ